MPPNIAMPPQYGVLDRKMPIAFLPVRLETRVFWDPSSHRAELRVRIFPDALHVVEQRSGLSSLEQREGKSYWDVRSGSGDEGEPTRRAWTRLVELVGDVRALVVVQLLRPTVGADGKPSYPVVVTSDDPSSHVATGLPDQWAVSCFVDGQVMRTALSAAVPKELPLDPPPPALDAPAADIPILPLWLGSFAEAEKVGMAVRIPLPSESWTTGPLTILAMGVRTSQTPVEGAATLTSLLAAHASGNGLAVVPVGTPTNNTETQSSGYRTDGAAADEARVTLVAGEAGAPAGSENGARLARAFGLDPGALRFVHHAHEDSDGGAAAMNVALWPATWGYFLDLLLRPLVSDAGMRHGRQHFINHVRARGPLTTLRVGAQPYAVLPIVDLERWKGSDDNDTMLAVALQALKARWRPEIGATPRIQGPTDAVAQLEAVLSMRAVGSPGWKRHLVGREAAQATSAAWRNPFSNFVGLFDTLRDLMLKEMLAPLGLIGTPPVSNLVLDDGVVALDLPLVSSDAPNGYIAAIAEATPDALLSHAVLAGAPPPTLLYVLLRHATLLSYARASDALQSVPASVRAEVELVDATQSTPWKRLHQLHPSSKTYADYLHQGLAPTQGNTPGVAEAVELMELRASLRKLAQVPAAELERLAAETLDLASHRLDAWVSSMATKRLFELRVEKPQGVYLGGFGWLEGLRLPPSPPPPMLGLPWPAPAMPTDDHPVDPAAASQGFVHAPSLAHAKTAAVLAAGRLAHRADGDGTSLAVNLSSDRVRKARWLLDGIQGGQSFAALLGYRAERYLIDHAQAALVESYRTSYPLTVTSNGSSDGARCVDGLKLYGGLQDAQKTKPLPGTLQPLFDELHEHLDASADLLLAEAVHQTVQGQPARARVALEAMESFDRSLPRLDVARTPVDSERTAVRVVLALPDRLVGWSGDEKRHRAMADQRLNALAAQLLGDPALLVLTARERMPGDTLTRRPLTLAELDVCPLDVVAHAGDGAAEPPLYGLARGCWRQREPGVAVEALVQIEANPALIDALYAARALRRLLLAARPLELAHLSPPEIIAPDTVTTAALTQRATKVGALVSQDYSSVAHFVADAKLHPGVAPTPEALAAIRRAAALIGPDVLGAADPAKVMAPLLAGRSSEAQALPATDPRARLRALVGKDTVVSDSIAWPGCSELGATVFRPEAASAWLHDFARVRPALEALDEVILLAPDAAGLAIRGYLLGDSSQLIVVGASPGTSVNGYLVDTWTEARPTGTATTGVAFRYDEPSARPPQAVLLAVLPDPSAGWDLGTLNATVLEALELAKLRLVAPPSVAGQFLPATFLAQNTSNDTISTDLGTIAVPTP